MIEASKTDPKVGMMRNDFPVAVAVQAHDNQHVKSLKGIDPHLLKEIEHSFVIYNEVRGKKLELIATRSPARTVKRRDDGIRLAQNEAS